MLLGANGSTPARRFDPLWAAIRASAAPLIAAVVALAVYVRTLLPGVAFGDWAEMQTVPHVLGISHPTGYPTYLIVAYVAQLIPIGSVAFRGNLLSAVLMSAAIGVMVLIAQRLGVRPWIAMASGLALAFSGTIWESALIAEVNGLHLLLIALILHRALVWAETPSTRELAIGGSLVGLSLGNHLLTVMVAPLIVAFVVWSGRGVIRRRPVILLVPIAAAAAALLVYLYIPIRAAQAPVLAYNHPDTLDRFVELVSGAQFREKFGFLQPSGPGRLIDDVPALASLIVERSTIFLPIAGLVGIALLLRARPAVGALLAGVVLVGLYVYSNYDQLEHYLLVPLLGLAVAGGAALESLARAVPRRSVNVDGIASGRVVAAIWAVVAVALLLGNWQVVDRSADRRGDAYIDQVFDVLPPDAAILSYWHASTPLWYGQHVDGRRRDVLILDDSNIVNDGWGTREDAIAALVCARPVFIIRPVESELDPTRARFTLRRFATIAVGAQGASTIVRGPLHEVVPDARSCPPG